MDNFFVGIKFFNSRKELCIVKSVTDRYVYVEIVDDIDHYKVMTKNFNKYLLNGKYIIATEIGKLLYG